MGFFFISWQGPSWKNPKPINSRMPTWGEAVHIPFLMYKSLFSWVFLGFHHGEEQDYPAWPDTLDNPRRHSTCSGNHSTGLQFPNTVCLDAARPDKMKSSGNWLFSSRSGSRCRSRSRSCRSILPYQLKIASTLYGTYLTTIAHKLSIVKYFIKY